MRSDLLIRLKKFTNKTAPYSNKQRELYVRRGMKMTGRSYRLGQFWLAATAVVVAMASLGTSNASRLREIHCERSGATEACCINLAPACGGCCSSSAGRPHFLHLDSGSSRTTEAVALPETDGASCHSCLCGTPEPSAPQSDSGGRRLKQSYETVHSLNWARLCLPSPCLVTHLKDASRSQFVDRPTYLLTSRLLF